MFWYSAAEPARAARREDADVALVEKGKLERCGSAGGGNNLTRPQCGQGRGPVCAQLDRPGIVLFRRTIRLAFTINTGASSNRMHLATRSGREPDREGGDEVLLNRYGCSPAILTNESLKPKASVTPATTKRRYRR